MVVVSYSGKEINAKLVYYGPGLCGKTTNLEYVYDSIPSTHRGKMVSMKTRTERTLFFDFLPVDLGELGGFKTRFLLYTVPGQVYYNATRKLVLRGVDAVVFVADSARGKMNENIESLENLRENLREYGLDLATMPWVLQYNKRDLPDVYTVEELNKALNSTNVPWFEGVATNGTGVFETLKGVSRILLEKLSKEIKIVPRAGEAASRSGENRPATAAPPKAGPPSTPAEPARVGSDRGPAPIPATGDGAAKTDTPARPMAEPPVAPALSKQSPTEPVPYPATAAPEAAPARPAAMATVTPLTVSKRPADAVPVMTSSVESPGAAAAGTPETTGQLEPADTFMESIGTEKPPGFFGRIARFFGFGPVEPEPMTSMDESTHEPPVAVAQMPRTAVITAGESMRIARLDEPIETTDSSGVLVRRIQVPVTLELTADEIRSGARIRLTLDIDLAAGEVQVEREVRTGTR